MTNPLTNRRFKLGNNKALVRIVVLTRASWWRGQDLNL